MDSCCATFCAANEHQFNAVIARRDLKRYRRRGPDATTRLLRDAILQRGAIGSALDVGAGIGALSFELLAAGVPHVTAVDAASAYLAAAREEATRRNLADRLQLLHGDFVAVGPRAPSADVVAMDRVVCCYPAYEPLLEGALRRTRRFFAFSYPRDRWYVRAMVATMNRGRTLFRNPYRGFVHSVVDMHALLERHGFSALSHQRTLVWAVELFARTDAADNA